MGPTGLFEAEYPGLGTDRMAPVQRVERWSIDKRWDSTRHQEAMRRRIKELRAETMRHAQAKFFAQRLEAGLKVDIFMEELAAELTEGRLREARWSRMPRMV